MYFHLVNNLPIIVQGWRIQGTPSLAISIFLIFALALLYECISSFHTYVSTKLKLLYQNNNNQTDGEISMKYLRFERYKKGQLCLSTFLYVTQMLLAFLVMLVVMTFQVWAIVTAVIAIGIGYHFSEPLISRGIDVAYRRYLEQSEGGCSNPPPRLRRAKEDAASLLQKDKTSEIQAENSKTDLAVSFSKSKEDEEIPPQKEQLTTSLLNHGNDSAVPCECEKDVLEIPLQEKDGNVTKEPISEQGDGLTRTSNV